MTSHCKISLTTALLAALVAVMPSCASANSLLSGYGGPGAGNQAILGSTLIGGGGSAGGGGSSGSSGSTGSTGAFSGSSGSTGSTGASSGSAAVAGAARTGGAGSAGASERGVEAGARGKGAGGQSASGTTGSRRGHGKASGGAAHAYPVTPLDDVSKPASIGSGALGFSAADLGYLLVALAVLGVTGVVTRRLARAPTPPEGLR